VDNDFLALPPGGDAEVVTQCAAFDSDSLLLSLTPHMHYRGKDARFEIQRPGQRVETLLFVPKYFRTIRWGEPSEEEMMSGWIDYIEESPNTASAQPVTANGAAAR
jgi:hypothetical protein